MERIESLETVPIKFYHELIIKVKPVLPNKRKYIALSPEKLLDISNFLQVHKNIILNSRV